MSEIFGGSKSKSVGSSYNKSYDYLQGALGGQVGQGGLAGTQMANLLGLNGAQGQNDAFNNWRNSTGYQFGLNQGMDAITGNAAAGGLLNSGSTAKALNSFGQDYASTQYGNYMQQLMGLSGQGLNAANTIGGAGNVSNQKSTSSSTNGFGGGIGSLLAK